MSAVATVDAVEDDEWLPFVCKDCGETIEQPRQCDVFDHRMNCQQGRINVARLAAQREIEPFCRFVEDLESHRGWMRRIDRTSPEMAARMVNELEAIIQRREWEEMAELRSYELQLWAFQRRASGEKLFPYRKG